MQENKEEDRKVKRKQNRLAKIEVASRERKQRDSLIEASSPSLSGSLSGVEDIASDEPVGKRVKTELL